MKWLFVASIVLFLLILWRLDTRTVPIVSFDTSGLLLRFGTCRLHIPLSEKIETSFTADVLTIERTVMKLPGGAEVVDEKIFIPERYGFGKALPSVIRAIFPLKTLETKIENDKAVLLEGVLKDGRKLHLLAVYRGKPDLELLYGTNRKFFDMITECLFEGKREKTPGIFPNDSEAPLPLSGWSEKLFDLDMLINKDM
ncbi:hypothetical protein [Hydrogenimonas sp.]